MKGTKTRFAPSPTGYIHIGNVRSAIYPYLIARQSGGKFILRIEDTDQARYVEGATELIVDTLRWLGLEWDEGIIVGGPNEPYFQSERKDIYHEWAKKLVMAGRAYVDTTSSEEIQAYHDADTKAKIPYLFRNHRPASADWSAEETLAAWKDGVALRFKSDPKEYSWHDEVMGDMHTGPEVCDDIILIKKDGLPTYNFAHIVDDAEMEVSHIARGVEYLSSMPNYLALYEALDLEAPKFLSLPHILAPTGNKKLGKRDGAKSVTEYRDDGILSEAMLNYLACLGWNDGTEQEIYSKADLLKTFSIERIQNSGARFDETKILWYNGQWIRKIADEQGIEALYARTTGEADKDTNYDTFTPINFWPECANSSSDDYKKSVLSIIYDRLKTLSDLRTMTGYFFEDPTIDIEQITDNKFLKKLELNDIKALLEATIEKLDNLTDWNEEALQNALNELLAASGKKPAEYFSLVRIAVSYAPFSPALHQTLNVLEKDTTIRRLRATLEAL